jgi:hypothetical protein
MSGITTNAPAASGHRQDLATYIPSVGAPPNNGAAPISHSRGNGPISSEAA